jgi:hypothetical protein
VFVCSCACVFVCVCASLCDARVLRDACGARRVLQAGMSNSLEVGRVAALIVPELRCSMLSKPLHSYTQPVLAHRKRPRARVQHCAHGFAQLSGH